MTDPSTVAEARRQARALATGLDFSDTRAEEVAIVASEAATNLLKHAGGGRVLLQVLPLGARPWLSVAALDTGPGIPDLDDALTDGVSTRGSAGTGLGAMRRLSDRFEVHSEPGRGTVVLCEFGLGPREIAGVQLGAFLSNYPGETACGDAWTARARAGAFELLVVDGLGHGPRAEQAAAEAVRAFGPAAPHDPGEALAELSGELTGTRGSVAGLVRIEAADGRLVFSGIGNISGLIVSPAGEFRRLVSRDGRLGGASRGPAPDTRSLSPGDTVILHSDGIATLRERDGARELFAKSPAMIAAVLMRDFNRGRDDACVAVARVVKGDA